MILQLKTELNTFTSLRLSKLSLKLTLGLIISILSISTNEVCAQTDQKWPLWRTLDQGDYSIGFKVINATTKDKNGKDRVVRIAMWYPAQPDQDAPLMKFKDYLEVQPENIPNPAFEAYMNQQDRESLSKQYFDSEADARQESLMNAIVPIQANAPAADGSFPLVVHSLGRNGNQFQHTILWEYLASHGYVVVSIGQYGKNLKDPNMAFKYKDLAYHYRDMQESISWLDQLPFIDTKRVGLLGHSSGAILSLWLASKDQRVKAVVGLDGSMNREENQKVYLKGICKENLAVPVLNICRWPHDEYYGNWTEQFQGPITRIGFERAIHFDFQNWPAYQAFADGQEPSSLTFRSLKEAETVFVSTAKFTKLYLDAYIKDDESAKLGMDNTELIEGTSNGQASLTLYPASKN